MGVLRRSKATGSVSRMERPAMSTFGRHVGLLALRILKQAPDGLLVRILERITATGLRVGNADPGILQRIQALETPIDFSLRSAALCHLLSHGFNNFGEGLVVLLSPAGRVIGCETRLEMAHTGDQGGRESTVEGAGREWRYARCFHSSIEALVERAELFVVHAVAGLVHVE